MSLTIEMFNASLMPVMQTVTTSPLGAPEDAFSIVKLFMHADWIIKSIIIGLMLASLWSWAITIDKFISIRLLKRRASDFEETFWSGRTLDELEAGLGKENKDPMGRIFSAAMREWRESKDPSGRPLGDLLGTRERLDRVMNLVINREIEKAQGGLSVLATVGATAPFVGLLGTVWGILNTFRAVSAANNAGFITILPGITEALFLTAIGLVVAIPAVIFYNKFAGDINKYASRLEGYADELSAILSRKMSKGG